ncbi:hypothetical protein Tco_0437263, partial [Tanacetum coccineum]
NLDNLDAMEMAQKAKIKWAVEGNENTGFFHGIINKRRNVQNIRGVMAEAMSPMKKSRRRYGNVGLIKLRGPTGSLLDFFVITGILWIRRYLKL